MTPWDFFMHLLGFAMLYAAVVSFLALLFQYVNVLFPDKLNFFYTAILNNIRISTATLLVVFIVFLLINWLLEKDFKKIPAKRDLKFRKWLIYFTLFISAVTIVVDLITLVYNFYSGELSIRFYLKVAVVLIVAACIFGYYFWDLKRQPEKKYQLPKILAWVTAIVITGVIVAGFFIVGSPAEQRQRRFDEQKISDLQMIQSEIINYWQQKNKLPATLAELKNSISGFNPPLDPETNQAYEYNIKDNLTFDLCAVFAFESLSTSLPNVPMEASPYNSLYQQNWKHAAGQACFSRTIDPELYKNIIVPKQ
jgi:hypothetical protein